MKTHIPHRSWYPHCVRGRERNDPHRSGGGRSGPRYHLHLAIDYGFLKANNPYDPADQGSNPILMGAEAKYGLTLAIAKRVAEWLDCLGSQNGHCEVRQQASHPRSCPGDSEAEERRSPSSSILRRERSRATILLRAPKGFIRTLKSSAESNLRTEIGPSHPLVPRIIEHAALLKNRYMVGADCRTSDRDVERRSSASCVRAWRESFVLASCSCPTMRLWRKVRLWDLLGLQIIRWPGVH